MLNSIVKKVVFDEKYLEDEYYNDDDEDTDSDEDDGIVMTKIKHENLNSPTIFKVIEKVRTVAVSLKKSGLKFDRFQSISKSQLHLILDVKTRWNSTFAMLDRFLDLAPDVNLYLEKYEPNLVFSES